MNIKIEAVQILVVLWLARGQNALPEERISESSEEVRKLIRQMELPIINRSSPAYGNFKEYFIRNRNLENDLHWVNKEADDMDEEIQHFRELMPHSDFICALNFMKYDLTEIFTNVAGVSYTTEADDETEWPFRIQRIRRIYDDYGKVNCRVYSDAPGRNATDNINYRKWVAYVTSMPSSLEFISNRMKSVLTPHAWDQQKDTWRNVAANLQGNLTEYFDNLRPELRKLRYDDDKNNLSSTFAAVLQRGYRLSCYFEHTRQHVLKELSLKTYPNGTRLFFQSAFQRVEPKWYFPAEHIDMYNILINATHRYPVGENDLMFIALKLPHPRHDAYIIPGKKTCSREPSVPKRKRKYATKLTRPDRKSVV